MVNKEALNHLAVQVAQIRESLKYLQNQPGLSLSANHEHGVTMAYCNMLENKLIKLASRTD